MVQASTKAAGGAWEPPVDLSSPGEDSLEPRMAMNAAGHAVAVWVRFGSQPTVQAASRSPQGNWGEPVDISVPDYGGPSDLDVAIDPAGNAVVVWTRLNYDKSSSYVIEAVTKQAGGQWTPQVELSEAGNNAWGPRLAVDETGHIVAVWSRWNDAGDTIVQAIEKDPGEAWSETEDLSLEGDRAHSAVVEISEGKTVVAWARDEDEEEEDDELIEATAKEASGPWEEPVEISELRSTIPKLGMDAQGNVLALWTSESEDGLTPEVSTLPIGGTWTNPIPLSEPNPVDGLEPEIAVDPAGRAAVVWRAWNGTSPVIEARTGSVGGGWGTPVPISPPEAWSSSPEVAMDGAGNVATVWRAAIKSDWTTQARVFDATSPVLNSVSIPPLGRAGRPIAFSAAPFDAWSPTNWVRWAFGDGSTAGGSSAVHSFEEAGRFQVTVTATDAAGHSTVASGLIKVTPALAVSSRVVSVKNDKARLSLHCPGTADCRGGARLTRRIAGRKGPRRARLTRYFKFTISANARQIVTTRLKPKALKFFRDASRKGLRAELTGNAVEPRDIVLRPATTRKPKPRR